MPLSSPPDIFSPAARLAKRRRAQNFSGGHDFIHVEAALDVVDRLESVLKPFAQALFYGAGAMQLATALTELAGVGEFILADEIAPKGNAKTTTISAAASALPFANGQFDLVVSTMALHAINDLPTALREARRVLKPDGLFIATFPGERTLHELRWALREAEAALTDQVAPRIMPFVAVKDGGALLQAAGFALPVADITKLPVSYRHPFDLITDLRGTGETCHLRSTPRGALRRDVFAKAMALYADKYPSEDGGILASVQLITLTGWAPHKSQPKALKPGSAKSSLKEAISQQIQKDKAGS